jgi:hypothetical protein
MNAQNKAMVSIPNLIRIFTLLITVVAGAVVALSEQEIIQIPETRAITLEAQSHQALATAFRDGADAAALQTEVGVAADLVVELRHAPLMLIAMSESLHKPVQEN